MLVGEYAWYANPAFALSPILEALGWARVSLVLAVLAAILALSSFLVAGWYFDASGVTEIRRFGFGFYLRLLAMLCPLLLHAAHPPRTQEWDAE